ncbi:MAG: Sip1-related alpha-galactosidase [Bacteroidales bacterium]
MCVPAQDTFLYNKGKSFDNIPSLQMDHCIELDKLSTTVLYERHTPKNQQTLSYRINLPVYIRGVFLSRDFRHGDHGWPNNTNRLLPWVFNQLNDITNTDYQGIPSNGQPSVMGDAIIIEKNDGRYLYAKVLSGDNSISWFKVNSDGSLMLYVSTLGHDALPKQVPLLLTEQAGSIYEVLRLSYKSLIANKSVSTLKVRDEKEYFEAFDYLGWCTWEHYHADIDEAKIEKDLTTIEMSGIPIRYILIDDGHIASNDKHQLISLTPDVKRFPNGWENLMKRKNENGIKWFGIWYGLSGYWTGISAQNELPEAVKRNLYLHNGSLLPGKSTKDIKSFYKYYVKTLNGYGFDFLKIDNQSFTLPLYMGGTQVVRQAKACNLALEEETHRQEMGLMNCMAQNILNTDNTQYSAVTRVSIDYKKFDENMAKSHLFQSYTNTLLQGQTVWPDHDMFHSSDSICGGLMARSKAISGGPVYLSDSPDEFVREYIEPLIDQNGKLFRPKAPAIPTPESILTNPLQSGKAYRVAAPTGDEALALICYNLNTSVKNQTVTANISKADFGLKSAWNKTVEESGNRVLIYDWQTGSAEELITDKKIELKGFTDRLFHLCPILDGWAVIGLQDKYLSPATVEILSRNKYLLKLKVLSSGILKVWVEKNGNQELRSILINAPQEIIINK